MKLFCSSFLPDTRTLSALTTTTKSPVSTCGVKIVFSLPRKSLAPSPRRGRAPGLWHQSATICGRLHLLWRKTSSSRGERGAKTTGDARTCQPSEATSLVAAVSAVSWVSERRKWHPRCCFYGNYSKSLRSPHFVHLSCRSNCFRRWKFAYWGIARAVACEESICTAGGTLFVEDRYCHNSLLDR